jgi:hypothetical protein
LQDIASFQDKPPAATALAVDPNDNNLVVLGLDDATIAVYNVRQDSVEWASKKTHKAAVTGAAREMNSIAPKSGPVSVHAIVSQQLRVHQTELVCCQHT